MNLSLIWNGNIDNQLKHHQEWKPMYKGKLQNSQS